jgi:hypothetical protein
MNQAKIVASAVKVPCGWKNAVIPTPMKRSPRTARTTFQPPDEAGSATNSFTPAAMATIPNMIATAYTVSRSSWNRMKDTQSQAIPVMRNSHQ